MTLGPRIGRKKDSTHDAIVNALEECGAKVVDLHKLGGSVPDLFVTVGTRFTFAECKSGRAKLTPGQADFAKEHPVKVLRSVAEAVQMVTDMRTT